jgi:hypothetical protein
MAKYINFEFKSFDLDINEQFRKLNKDIKLTPDVEAYLRKLGGDVVKFDLANSKFRIIDGGTVEEFQLSELTLDKDVSPLKVLEAKINARGGRLAEVYRTHLQEQINTGNFASEAQLKKLQERNVGFRDSANQAYRGLELDAAVQEKFVKDLQNKFEAIKNTKTSSAVELAKFLGKAGLIAGLGSAAVLAMQKVRNGCYLYNVGSDKNVLKVNEEENEGKCGCGPTPLTDCTQDPFGINCCSYCQSDATWKGCVGASCNCTSKNKAKKPSEQYGYRVVKGGFFDTIAGVLASVGIQIVDFAEGIIDIAESITKSLAQLFSQWWVILILIVVGLAIVLVPVLVTQVPKAKRSPGALQGGSSELFCCY